MGWDSGNEIESNSQPASDRAVAVAEKRSRYNLIFIITTIDDAATAADDDEDDKSCGLVCFFIFFCFVVVDK